MHVMSDAGKGGPQEVNVPMHGPSTPSTPSRASMTSRRSYRRPSRGPNTGKFGIIVIVIVIAVAAMLLIPQIRVPLTELFNPSSYREYPETAEFTVEREIKITNVVSHNVDIPKPKDLSNLQQVISIVTTPTPTSENKYGSEWMIWNQSGNADITITYRIKTETIAWNLKSSDVMTVEEALEADETFQYLTTKYNKKEWKIDPADPEIVILANQLNVDGTIFDQAKSIFDNLESNYAYKTERAGGEVHSPTETIQNKSGDCDDMSFLFIAVSRAMGIPAWIELGSMYDESTQQWIGHAWVALYLPMNDADRSGIVNIDVVNREFLVRGANRFSDWSSDGEYTDKNGNGTIEEDEWHLRDYYYMYYYNPLPGNIYLSDESTGLEYKESGSVTVKLGGEQSVPFLDFVLLIPVIIIAYTAIALKRSRQKR